MSAQSARPQVPATRNTAIMERSQAVGLGLGAMRWLGSACQQGIKFAPSTAHRADTMQHVAIAACEWGWEQSGMQAWALLPAEKIYKPTSAVKNEASPIHTEAKQQAFSFPASELECHPRPHCQGHLCSLGCSASRERSISGGLPTTQHCAYETSRWLQYVAAHSPWRPRSSAVPSGLGCPRLEPQEEVRSEGGRRGLGR